MLENIYHALKAFTLFRKFIFDFCEIYLTFAKYFLQLIENKTPDWKIYILIGKKTYFRLKTCMQTEVN